MDDPVFLSRLQFAITIGFHFLFPPVTIGLAWLLVVVEGVAWRKKSVAHEQAGRFLAKLLALTFAVGVATGIVMEFQFGTNWAEYSKFVGDIFGAPLAAEAIFAFFLESAFLGLYLFGRGKVRKSVHWFSILMVAIGSTISAFWIIVANSWQQTPAGHIYNEALNRAELADFWAVVLNPSMVIRFHHVLAACLVAGAFFVAGVCAYRLRWDPKEAAARVAMKPAVVLGLVAALVTAFPTGHEHARQVAHTQPEKFAAMEGLIQTEARASVVAFGLARNKPPEVTSKLEVPISGLLSWLAFGDVEAEVRGLDAFPADEVPPLWITFVSFHNMVILGMLMVGLMAWAMLQLLRRKLWESRRFLKLLIYALPLPLVACQFGWVAAEVGRQPWVVYKLLRTRDAVSTTLTAAEIWFSIIMFTVIYSALLCLYLFLLARAAKRGPQPIPAGEATY